MENSQQPKNPLVQENTVSQSNKSLSLPLLLGGVVLVVAIVAGGIGYYLGFMSKTQNYPTPLPEQVSCTMEAKLCPDGSSVGRSGPNCEFVECPIISESKPEDWKFLENSNLGFNFSYPSDLIVFNLNRTAGNQEVLYELSRSEVESKGDFSSGVYLISFYPNTSVEDFFAQFEDSVYISNNITQIMSNGLTIHIERTIAPDGPGAGIETMMAAVELNDGVLTFDLVSNGPTREQDAIVLETVLNTLVIE